MELSLTRHFEERWLERVGNWPTPEAIDHYLKNSVLVQRCEDFIRPDGSPFRMLAIYWHPELDIVMKVDTMEATAVTVLSRENWRRRDPFIPGSVSVRPGLSKRIALIKAAFGRSLAA